MRRVTILMVLMTATTLLLSGAAFTQSPEPAEDTDPYIVVLEDSVAEPAQVAEMIEGRQESLDVEYVYSETIEGFSAQIPDGSVDEVRNNPRVAYVAPDRIVRTTAQTTPWGVRRIGADASSGNVGEGVNIYAIDTGIDKKHPDLNDNVVRHVSFQGDKNRDCDGHGTHVAGTLAAENNASGVVGVAPGASLIGVKVLGCQGGGRVRKVIKGVDWVTADAQRSVNANTPAVVNMSLGTRAVRDNPETPEVEVDPLVKAVRQSALSGVFYSLSAGNLDGNACGRTPARAGAGANNGIVTTAATRKSNEEAGYSNHGSCVDLWAPGNRILSTKLGGGTTLSSGTSMAAPHVGGTAALYLSAVNDSATPVQVERVLKTTAEDTGKRSEGVRPIRLVSARNALSPTP